MCECVWRRNVGDYRTCIYIVQIRVVVTHRVAAVCEAGCGSYREGVGGQGSHVLLLRHTQHMAQCAAQLRGRERTIHTMSCISPDTCTCISPDKHRDTESAGSLCTCTCISPDKHRESADSLCTCTCTVYHLTNTEKVQIAYAHVHVYHLTNTEKVQIGLGLMYLSSEVSSLSELCKVLVLLAVLQAAQYGGPHMPELARSVAWK